MILAASTRCFKELSLHGAFERLVDLEYSNVEIAIHESGGQLKPSQVFANPEAALEACRQTYRLTPVAFSVEIEAEGEEYYDQFLACCRLAKAIKVVPITVPAAELGTPFNAEIDRLKRLVALASVEGILVGIKSETGRMTEDPETAVVLCNHVKGLGITLDPSHYVYGPLQGGSYDQVFKHVYHVQLRDTSKTQLQVRVGQGEIEYGRLLSQLSRHGYKRCLSVDIQPMDDVEHVGELRKIRLLLESLL